MQVSGGRNVHCHFIPAVSGFYQFRIDTDAEIYAEIVGQEQTWSRVLMPEDNGMISVYLHGGKTAWIDVYSTAGASVSVTVVPSGHDMTWVEPKEATFEAAGNIGYYVCKKCGGFFADADAAEEFMDHASVVIPQLQPPVEEIPNTGDASVVIPVAVLMILSGAGLVLTLIMMKRAKDD